MQHNLCHWASINLISPFFEGIFVITPQVKLGCGPEGCGLIDV